MPDARRRWPARVLFVLGGVLAGLTLLVGHVNRVVLDGPTFADKVDEVRRSDDVSTQLGRAIAQQVLDANPDLVALQPLVESVAIRAAGSDLLSGPVQAAARTAHRALTEEDADLIVLRVSDAAAVVTGVLAVVAPEQAPVTADVSVTLAEVGDQSFASSTIAIV